MHCALRFKKPHPRALTGAVKAVLRAMPPRAVEERLQSYAERKWTLPDTGARTPWTKHDAADRHAWLRLSSGCASALAAPDWSPMRDMRLADDSAPDMSLEVLEAAEAEEAKFWPEETQATAGACPFS